MNVFNDIFFGIQFECDSFISNVEIFKSGTVNKKAKVYVGRFYTFALKSDRGKQRRENSSKDIGEYFLLL